MPIPLILALAAQAAPPPPVLSDRPFPPPPSLLIWEPVSIRCEGEAVVAVEPPHVAPIGGYAARIEARPAGFSFTIDATGRTLDIVPDRPGFASEPLAAAVAAARFAAGQPHRACRATFTATRSPIAEAPVAAVMEHTVFPNERPDAAAWRRIAPDGSDCLRPSRAPLVRRYPDFAPMPKRAGSPSWTMIGYDLDRRGRPVRPHVVAGSGHAPLDRAAVVAVKGSRFVAGARRGCLYPYRLAPADLPAPPPPSVDAYRPAGATCPAEPRWARRPTLTYPEAFSRRRIEGWAIVGYDVAPWGEIGNARVLAAQPAAAFGERAVQVLRSATHQGGPGYTGCVERVAFRMAPPDAPPAAD